MKISFANKESAGNELIVPVFENEFQEAEKLTGGIARKLASKKEFEGKKDQIQVVHTQNGKIVLVGLGDSQKLSLEIIRQAYGKAASVMRDNSTKKFSVILPECLNSFDEAKAAVEGMLLSLYKFSSFKTVEKDEKIVEEIFLLSDDSEAKRAVKEAIIICDAVLFTRDLQNHPSSIATPQMLGKKALESAKKFGFKCKVYGKNELEKMGMNAILAVNKGSAIPPALIVMEYNGGKETICLVGKGITFDSGGISLKPSAAMDEMKFDMSGGAAVIGIMQAAARLKLPLRIVGIVPSTENMPGGKAYKPGDIIKTYLGKTIEVLDTDAEGRIILSDGLAFAQKFKPSAIIDYATLTGACVVALGNITAGLMGNDDQLIKKIIEAGNATNEKAWQLPMFDDYKEDIKSQVADIKNLGAKGSAGAISAAMFLKEFVGNCKWAHLDIAGTAWTTKDRPYKPFGGTGFGVRLTIELLKNWNKQ